MLPHGPHGFAYPAGYPAANAAQAPPLVVPAGYMQQQPQPQPQQQYQQQQYAQQALAPHAVYTAYPQNVVPPPGFAPAYVHPGVPVAFPAAYAAQFAPAHGQPQQQYQHQQEAYHQQQQLLPPDASPQAVPAQFAPPFADGGAATPPPQLGGEAGLRRFQPLVTPAAPAGAYAMPVVPVAASTPVHSLSQSQQQQRPPQPPQQLSVRVAGINAPGGGLNASSSSFMFRRSMGASADQLAVSTNSTSRRSKRPGPEFDPAVLSRALSAIVRDLPPQASSMAVTAASNSSEFAPADAATPASLMASEAAVRGVIDAYAAAHATDEGYHAGILHWAHPVGLRALAARLAADLRAGKRDPLPPAWVDVTERRGTLLVAVVDALVSICADDTRCAKAAEALVAAFVQALPAFAASQLGCIATMRLVCATHHSTPLITALVGGLARCAEDFFRGKHAPYVLGHVVLGLDAEQRGDTKRTVSVPGLPHTNSSPVSRSSTPAPQHEGAPHHKFTSPQASLGRPLADCERRAAYVIEFAPWVASANPADHSAPASSTRASCDPTVWADFTTTLLALLRVNIREVLRGRQQCFLLWHLLRRIRALERDAGVRLLRCLTAEGGPRVTWPPTPPLASSDATLLASADAKSESFERDADVSMGGNQGRPGLTPLSALCRSTAGRCCLSSLLTEFAALPPAMPGLAPATRELVRALVGELALLAAAGLPAIDHELEATLKVRPGMSAAQELPAQLAVFMRGPGTALLQSQQAHDSSVPASSDNEQQEGA